MNKIFARLIAPLILLVGCNRKPPDMLSATSVTIQWTHPQIKDASPAEVTDPVVATRLYKLFDDIDSPQNGTPWDTPFYDAVLTFTRPDGRTIVAKVYLPRERVFPGMWKHPSGTLNYFEDEQGQSRELVSILKPLMPRHAVYPDSLDEFPPVNFSKGIPDFTDVNLPISGDFPKGYFKKGG